ncbi:MAG TPA: GAP family protein [Patescibacteria group bacterium]|nr:GAP family protein [Patescibacteria group bacterium]
MEKHIADILPYATAVALSPMPVAALILMLLSKKAKINSVAFTVGWIIGLAALVWLALYVIGLSDQEVRHATGYSVKTVIDVVLGLLLLFLAFMQFKNRQKKGQAPRVPKWMNAVEKFSPGKALVFGFLLATLNVKNTPMGITVGAAISDAGNKGLSVLIVYLVLASCTITIPTLGFLIFGKSLKKPLTSLKEWLVNNNATIMFILFLILGVILISKAFGF